MRLTLLLLAGWLLALPAWAESVTLADALRRAVADHPASHSAEARVMAAKAAATAAERGYWPHLGLNENFTVTDEPGASMFIWLNQERLQVSPDASTYNQPPTRHDFNTSLWLRQPLFDTDLHYGAARSRQGVAAAEDEAAWRRQSLAFAALRAYLGVQRAQAAQAVAASGRQEAAELLRLAQAHRAAGTGLKSDELQARVALAEAQRRQLRAQNDLHLARRALALAVGCNGGELDIAASVKPEAIPAVAGVVPQQRADLQALAARTEEASLAARQSRADWWPKAQLQAAYNLHDETPFGAQGDSFTVLAGLSWEFFDGGQRGQRQAAAEARRQALAQQQEQGRREAELALETARLRGDEARQQRQSALAARSEAEENLRLLRQRYDAGLAPLADVLRAQTLLDRARQAVVASEANLAAARGAALYQNGTLYQQLAEER